MDKNVKRYNVGIKTGLNEEQVNQRKLDKLTNKTKLVVGKSYGKIIFDNVFSFFAILLYIIFIFMLIGNIYSEGRFLFSGCFFMVILLGNIVIGLYEDIKARRLMDKMHLINAPKSKVIRGGEELVIPTEDIVLDDIIKYSTNDQICADSILLDGCISVNESQLTGEADNIYKNKGDVLYSGSYVTSGVGYARVDKVGKDSYIESIQSIGKKFKRSKSEILSSLNLLFRFIGIGVVIMLIATIVTYSIQGRFETLKSFAESIPFIGGCFVSMLPTGLYLLTSVSLAVAVISLAKKRANVQDFYSVEMLARTDTVCVDKTGTITDGTLKVNKVIPYGKYNENNVKSLIKSLVLETKDSNATAKAILKMECEKLELDINNILPFSSENKYSAISCKNCTYVFGAYEFIDCYEKDWVNKTSKEYVESGKRVLLLAKNNKRIVNNKVEGKCEVIGIIVLEDNIKPSAYETFKWFKESGVDIKVISGDNAASVSEIAKEVGIENYDKYISLEKVKDEEIYDIADKYTIFGRVSPEQKQLIIEALQKHKHTVAMTGDGVNDILALKKADCSIAMANGSEAARNISHIVMMDSDFASLPAVVDEGRRVINNLQRTCSLFLVKTLFAFIIAFVFLLATIITGDKSISYPFLTNHMYLWEFANLGLASLFLALEKNNDRLKGSFLKNTLFNAISAGLTVTLAVLTIFGGYLLNKNGVIYTGIVSIENATAMSAISFVILSFAILFKTCLPLNKYRTCVFVGAGVIDLCGLCYSAFIVPKLNNNTLDIFKINFGILLNQNYVFMIINLVVWITLYFLFIYLYEIFRFGEHIPEDK